MLVLKYYVNYSIQDECFDYHFTEFVAFLYKI